MSLLLDALKKAAEQKAVKSRAESLEGKSSDETVLNPPKEDISEIEQLKDSRTRRVQRAGEDETELDHSELETRLEQTRRQRKDGDETGLDVSEYNESDATEYQSPAGGARRDANETQLEVNEQTITQTSSFSAQMQTGEDETIIFAEEDVSEFLGEPEMIRREKKRPEDETDLSQVADDESAYRTARKRAGEDETDLSQVQVEAADDPSLVPQDDDMSLLLVDRDDTDISARTSAALGLVDISGKKAAAAADSERTSTTDASTTAIGGQTTQTRTDSTSTRTYAPDNYDRTLMKLPNEDASRIFAGMKADSDVVMTPDYAKKVFQSKSSAQRMQHYKMYVGIAIAIFLAIGIYGAFEYQDESFTIDTSLQPLKYDPMPGVIKPVADQKASPLFPAETTTEVDSKTIELIKNAETQSEGVIVDAESSEIAVPEVDAAPAVKSAAGSVSKPVQIASIAAEPVAAKTQTSKPSSSNLQISSSKRLEEKSIWLREAYDAYRSGNNVLALSKYNQVLKIDPANPNALHARAAISLQNGETSAAIRDYQALLLANPKDSQALSSLLSLSNYSLQETESQLKLMIRGEPDSAHLNFALANVYGAQNRWSEAQSHYFTALQNNPGDPNYAYNLAISLEHIAQPNVAISYYQRALDNFESGHATFSRDVVGQRLEMLRKL